MKWVLCIFALIIVVGSLSIHVMIYGGGNGQHSGHAGHVLEAREAVTLSDLPWKWKGRESLTEIESVALFRANFIQAGVLYAEASKEYFEVIERSANDSTFGLNFTRGRIQRLQIALHKMGAIGIYSKKVLTTNKEASSDEIQAGSALLAFADMQKMQLAEISELVEQWSANITAPALRKTQMAEVFSRYAEQDQTVSQNLQHWMDEFSMRPAD